MIQDAAAYQAAVALDIRRLLPDDAPAEFPPVTDAPQPVIPESFVWSQIYERQNAHVFGSRDRYEREAAERLWQGWNEWHRDRQAAWPADLAPATWTTQELELWAAWWKRLTAAERRGWEDRLGQESAWWRELADQEQAWWQEQNGGQERWLLGVLEGSRKQRQKGLFGLAAPDDGWQEWIDLQGEERLRELEHIWQEHRRALGVALERGSLKREWHRRLQSEMQRQLQELEWLAVAPPQLAGWKARIARDPDAATPGEWWQLQAAWAEAGEAAAEPLLASRPLAEQLRAALAGVPQDAFAAGRSLAPVLLGLAASGSLARQPAPLLAATLAVAAHRRGAAALSMGQA